MAWIPDNVINAMKGSHQLGIFLRIDTTPGLHIWFGVNDIPTGFDSIDPEGTVYLGGGRLIGVPTLEVLVNGTSDSVDFTISGIDAVAGAKVLDSIPAVRGCSVQMGITTLDDYYQPMSKVIPLWQGTASHIGESGPAVGSEENQSVTLSLSVVTGEATRSRPSRSLWSSAQQKSISPTDLFCDATARLSRGVSPVWPNY